MNDSSIKVYAAAPGLVERFGEVEWVGSAIVSERGAPPVFVCAVRRRRDSLTTSRASGTEELEVVSACPLSHETREAIARAIEEESNRKPARANARARQSSRRSERARRAETKRRKKRTRRPPSPSSKNEPSRRRRGTSKNRRAEGGIAR